MKLSKIKKLPIVKNLLKRNPRVMVVDLKGVIGSGGAISRGLNLEAVEERLTEAFTTKKIEAVALVINSPGGSPVQSDLIGQRIRALAEENDVRVLAFCEDVAASGGYWLACAADMIYATEASIIGSIGVISAGFGFPELIKRHGIERRVRTAGTSKSNLDPFREEKAEDVERLEVVLGDVHEFFKNWVRSRRGARLEAAENELFNGEFWTGKKAKDLGLIDEIGNLYGVLKGEYGKEVDIIKSEEKPSLIRRLIGSFASGLVFSAVDCVGQKIKERGHYGRFGL